MTGVSREVIGRLPKVLLHDHLDGGLRSATVVELAEQVGYDGLPSTDPLDLADWFRQVSDSGSLETYLESFEYTLAVVQTADALHRVAVECVADLAADGIVYAEVRFAPELHTRAGLTPAQVVDAVLAGFAEGERRSLRQGHPIRVRALLAAMRNGRNARATAELVVSFRDRGVVGFDIAGPEAGHPARHHLAAFEYLHRNSAHITIHAGEGFGLVSISESLLPCGAERLGHGMRIVDDITTTPAGEVRLGSLAAYVRDRRIPLEISVSSNVQTGASPSLADHPVGLLRDLGFRVTLNTDNRLMSATSLSREMHLCCETFGWDLSDLRWLTLNAMKSAFLHFDERVEMITDVIIPGFEGVEESLSEGPGGPADAGDRA